MLLLKIIIQLGLANKTFGENNVFLEMFGVLCFVAKTFLDPNYL